jgi:hypothetical protein
LERRVIDFAEPDLEADFLAGGLFALDFFAAVFFAADFLDGPFLAEGVVPLLFLVVVLAAVSDFF